MSTSPVTEPDDLVHLRNVVASLARRRQPDDPDLLHARRELAAAVLLRHVRHALDANPGLTINQRRAIAGVLTGAAS
ncbi:hypothetical protein [Cellulomonas alba]|uniref:Uncharacterized protein n=1 Tax=Cellulomonas alba TaxID=3053467 RepID=A0ABT7SKB4_9CELL|nr:hypothetical protein [Cellulomonas alba]MDM7856631.1 hypothetical protein [Cellulomonas alba]